MLHLVCCHLRLPVVIELVRLRRMAAAYFTKQSLPVLQLVRGMRIRDWGSEV